MRIPLQAMQISGGTSKGVYLLREDVVQYNDSLDSLLSALMGGAPRQIDGPGGATSATSKVAIVGRSSEGDIDIDYLFAQVDPRPERSTGSPLAATSWPGWAPSRSSAGWWPPRGRRPRCEFAWIIGRLERRREASEHPASVAPDRAVASAAS